jgi:hypothetical protein
MCGAKESDLDPREAQWKRWRWTAPAPPGAQQHHGEDDQPYRTVQHEEEVACPRVAWGPRLPSPEKQRRPQAQQSASATRGKMRP